MGRNKIKPWKKSWWIKEALKLYVEKAIPAIANSYFESKSWDNKSKIDNQVEKKSRGQINWRDTSPKFTNPKLKKAHVYARNGYRLYRRFNPSLIWGTGGKLDKEFLDYPEIKKINSLREKIKNVSKTKKSSKRR